MDKGMNNGTRVVATDNGDGTATIALTVDGRTVQATFDRENLLNQIGAAEASLRWSASRAAAERRRLWNLVGIAVEQQVAHVDLSGRRPTRIRVQSEEWDNGHFASDEVEVWFGSTAPSAQAAPEATIEIRDLSTTIDFDVFDGCCEGAAWTLDIKYAEVMPEAA